MTVKKTSQEMRKINTAYAAFTCVYGTKINISRQVVPCIDL